MDRGCPFHVQWGRKINFFMVKFSTIIKLFQTSKLYGVLSLKCVHNVLGHLLHSLECKLDESVWSCIDICNYVSREGWSSMPIRVGACFLRSACLYAKPKAPNYCSWQGESEYGLKTSDWPVLPEISFSEGKGTPKVHMHKNERIYAFLPRKKRVPLIALLGPWSSNDCTNLIW